jgi:hypothetical protein
MDRASVELASANLRGDHTPDDFVGCLAANALATQYSQSCYWFAEKTDVSCPFVRFDVEGGYRTLPFRSFFHFAHLVRWAVAIRARAAAEIWRFALRGSAAPLLKASIARSSRISSELSCSRSLWTRARMSSRLIMADCTTYLPPYRAANGFSTGHVKCA